MVNHNLEEVFYYLPIKRISHYWWDDNPQKNNGLKTWHMWTQVQTFQECGKACTDTRIQWVRLYDDIDIRPLVVVFNGCLSNGSESKSTRISVNNNHLLIIEH